VKIQPCAFCEGPPVPFIGSYVEGVPYASNKPLPDDGEYLTSHVFCHECGAQGPHFEEYVYEHSEVQPLIEQAINGWNERNGRHRSMYDHGEAERLNEYPRPEQRTGG
jgi:hypothetical protein